MLPRLALSLCLLTISTGTAGAQAAHGVVETITVHGNSLSNNLNHDSPDRPVTIYLPPAYKTDLHRRFPVVILLHGYKGSGAQWVSDPEQGLQTVLDRSIASGAIHPMIVVMPDAHTRAGGSFFVDSVADGAWETFIVRDLVMAIDTRYRTIPRAASRGIAGHSMGGYGALRIAFNHPDTFSSVYALSPCCIAWTGDFTTTNPAWQSTLSFTSFDNFNTARFMPQAFAAIAIAWSPDAAVPPLHADFPVRRTATGALEDVPSVRARWDTNLLITLAKTNESNLHHLHAIAFDAGRSDQFTHIPLGEADLDRLLSTEHISHTFELYDGDHNSGIVSRITSKVLPFFSTNLSPK
jgi:S-formylglutathione hydrolase